MGIASTSRINNEVVISYHQHLKSRVSERKNTKLGNYQINGHLKAIKKLAEYLYKTESKLLPIQHLKLEKTRRDERTVLTKTEVAALYAAIKNYSRYALRDRAMLALYYGCGLRRNEGISLHIKDLDFVRGFIHVREGKGNKERFVPMSKSVQEQLKQYIEKGRPLFSKGKYAKALFLNYRGQPAGSQSMYFRLKQLQQKSDSETLKEKRIGLHTLRHSIASHLLQNNVPLETIAQFLGHATLESTQIYTHIDENEFAPI
jgi:integrase/recombinase XerD